MTKPMKIIVAIAALVLTGCSGDAPQPTPSGLEAGAEPATLTIYSSRHYDSDKVLFSAYEAETGIKIDVREAKSDQLLETMKAEGDASPADIIVAADAGALWRFQDAGLTRASNDVFSSPFGPETQQEDGHWFGLTKRVRLVAYDPNRIEAEQVDDWFDLADPSLSGEICARSSSNIYNLSLMSEMIARVGSDAARAWATGVASNMARPPQGGDTDQIKAVAAGECSVAIANHYYWVRLAQSASSSDAEIAGKVNLIIPSFAGSETAHSNITGAAITSTADNPEAAADFLTYLTTARGQELLTTDTKEFPLNKDAALPEGTQNAPVPGANGVALDTFGENQAEAQRLYDLAGWN